MFGYGNLVHEKAFFIEFLDFPRTLDAQITLRIKFKLGT